MLNSTTRKSLLCGLLWLNSWGLALAQQSPLAELATPVADPVAAPTMTPEELDSMTYRWLRDYVAYIITDVERDAFMSLESTEQRLAFIDRFWKRRDPTPGTEANEARDDHMQRFSYANKHFGSGKPGWKSDRGRVYIMLGPPQNRQRAAMGRVADERASETWSYNGVKSKTLPASFDLYFVDFNDTSDYQLVSNLELAAPIRTYAGYIGNPLDLLTRAVNAEAQTSEEDFRAQRDTFNLEDLVRANFDLQRDLQAIQETAQEADLPRSEVETTLQFQNLPIQISTASFRSGEGLTRTQVSFSVSFSPLSSKAYRDKRYYHVEILSRVLIGGAGGTVADQVREDFAFQVPEAELATAAKTPVVYQFNHFTKPGTYTLELILRDAVSQRVAVNRLEIVVPELDGTGLGLSTPLLCESIRKVDSTQAAGAGSFRQGNLELLPRVSGRFKPVETMEVYLQVYGASRGDSGSHELQLGYRIWSAQGALVSRTPPQLSKEPSQGTVALYSSLPMGQLKPGRYELEVNIWDRKSDQRTSRRVPFQIE